MYKKNYLKLLATVFFSVVLLFGCDLFGSSSKKSTTVEPGKAEVLLDDYIALLDGGTRALNPAIQGVSTSTIKESISQKIKTLNLEDSDDLGELLPLFIETTQETFSTQVSHDYAVSDIKKITEVTTSLVTIYKTKEYYVKDGIYTSITKTIIKNLEKSQLTSTELKEAIGDTVKTVVSGIDTAIVKPADVGDTIKTLTKDAAEATIEASNAVLDITDEDKITLIQDSVSVVATSVVGSIGQIQKFDIQDSLRDQVYGDAASGATEAIKLVQSSEFSDSIDIVSFLETVTGSITTEVINMNDGSSASKIMSMTKESSKVAVTIGGADPKVVTTAILTQAVTRSKESDEGGTQFGSDYYNELFVNGTEVLGNGGDYALNETEFDALQTAIAAVSPQEITVNFAQFSNEKPVVIISYDDTDIFQIGTTTSILFDGSGSYDPDFVDGDTLTYKWTLITDTTPTVIDGETTNTLTLDLPTTSGEYFITLQVTDALGKVGSVMESFFVHPENMTDVAVISLQEAKAAMKLDNWTLAYEKLSEATEADPNNQEALLWWSTLSIAQIVIDPEMQTLMNNLGFTEYPTTMEDFIKGEYTEKVFLYGEEPLAEVTVSESDSNVVNVSLIKGENEYLKFPKVSIPTNLKDALADEESGEFLNFGQYFAAIMYNLQLNYPDGFNDIIDALVNSTNVLDDVTKKIDLLSNSSSMSISYDLFNDDTFTPIKSVWPANIDGTPQILKVGKAEFLASAATLEFIQSILYIIKSVSFEYDLDSYWTKFNPVDGTGIEFNSDGSVKGIKEGFDLSSVTNPLSTTALRARDDAAESIQKSKNYIVSSLTHLKQSTNMIVARDVNSSFYLSKKTLLPFWDMVVQGNKVAQIVFDKIIDSINSADTPFYIPDGLYANPKQVLAMDSISDWPTAADEADSISLYNFFNSETPVLSLENILEMRTNTEPQFYTLKSTGYTKVLTKADYDFVITNDLDFYLNFPNVTKGIINFADVNKELEDGNYYMKLDSDYDQIIPHSILPAGTDFNYFQYGFNRTKTSDGSLWLHFLNLSREEFDFVDDETEHYSSYRDDEGSWYSFYTYSELLLTKQVHLNTANKDFVFEAINNETISQYNYKIVKNTYEEGYDGDGSEPLLTEVILESDGAIVLTTPADEITITIPEVLMKLDNVKYHIEARFLTSSDKIIKFDRYLTTRRIELVEPHFMQTGETYNMELSYPRVDRVYTLNFNSNSQSITLGPDNTFAFTLPSDFSGNNASFDISSTDLSGNDTTPVFGYYPNPNNYSIPTTNSGYYFDLDYEYSYEDVEPGFRVVYEGGDYSGLTYKWECYTTTYNDVTFAYDKENITSGTGKEVTMPTEIRNYNVTFELYNGDTLLTTSYGSISTDEVLDYYFDQLVPSTITAGGSITIDINIPGVDSNVGSSWKVDKYNSWNSEYIVDNSNSITINTEPTDVEGSFYVYFRNDALYISEGKYIEIIQ